MGPKLGKFIYDWGSGKGLIRSTRGKILGEKRFSMVMGVTCREGQ